MHEYGRIIASVRYWDLASSTKSTADFTAGCKMHATSEGFRIIEDIVHGRFSPAQRDNLIKQTARRDGRAVPIFAEEEGGSSGKTVTLHYAKLLVGYTFRGDRPGADKITRAQSVIAKTENGLLILCDPNPRIKNLATAKEIFDELEAFPNGPHDDIVDAISGADRKLDDRLSLVGSTTIHETLGDDNRELTDEDVTTLPQDAPLRNLLEAYRER